MNFRTLITGLMLGLVAASGPRAETTAADWTKLMRSPEVSAEQRLKARSALTALATGPVEEAETRAAVFALAEYEVELHEVGRVHESTEAVASAVAHYGDDPRTVDLLRRLGISQAELQFWVLGFVVAIILGGSQALSRSLFSQMIPDHQEAEFFSFYEVSERGTSWLGTFIFGLVNDATGSLRAGILSLIFFFSPRQSVE